MKTDADLLVEAIALWGPRSPDMAPAHDERARRALALIKEVHRRWGASDVLLRDGVGDTAEWHAARSVWAKRWGIKWPRVQEPIDSGTA